MFQTRRASRGQGPRRPARTPPSARARGIPDRLCWAKVDRTVSSPLPGRTPCRLQLKPPGARPRQRHARPRTLERLPTSKSVIRSDSHKVLRAIQPSSRRRISRRCELQLLLRRARSSRKVEEASRVDAQHAWPTYRGASYPYRVAHAMTYPRIATTLFALNPRPDRLPKERTIAVFTTTFMQQCRHPAGGVRLSSSIHVSMRLAPLCFAPHFTFPNV